MKNCIHDYLVKERDGACPHSSLIVGAVSDAESWRALIKENRPSVCDVIELRVDCIPDDISLEDVLRFPFQKDVILTVRSEEEGGMWVENDEKRIPIIRKLLPISTMVDWEISHLESEGVKRLIADIHAQQKFLIASSHDFNGTPNLDALLAKEQEARRMGADCVKFSFFLKKPEDIQVGVKILEVADKPIAVMGMGQLGVVSRLLYGQLGSMLTYGAYGGADAAVPGQLPDELLRTLFDFIPLYSHSLSV